MGSRAPGQSCPVRSQLLGVCVRLDGTSGLQGLRPGASPDLHQALSVTAGAGTGPSPSQRSVGRSLKAPRQLQEPATGSLQGALVQLGWGWQLGHRPKGQRHLAQPGASLAQNASSTYLCLSVAARRAGGRLALRSRSPRACSTLPNTTPPAQPPLCASSSCLSSGGDWHCPRLLQSRA